MKVLSSFWGGSDIIKKAIVKYEPNLDELMNIMVTIFKYVLLVSHDYLIFESYFWVQRNQV